MMPPNNDEWIAEHDLARQLNVTRDLLMAHRSTFEGEVDRNGPWVVWKKTAATRFADSLGLTWPLADQKNSAESRIEVLTVASTPRFNGFHFPNPRIVRCRRVTGDLVDVQVMDSGKYTTHLRTGDPMTLRAQPSTSGTHWVLVGREPRAKGMW